MGVLPRLCQAELCRFLLHWANESNSGGEEEAQWCLFASHFAVELLKWVLQAKQITSQHLIDLHAPVAIR